MLYIPFVQKVWWKLLPDKWYIMVSFFTPKTVVALGCTCTISKILINFSLSHTRKLGRCNPCKRYMEFWSFWPRRGRTLNFKWWGLSNGGKNKNQKQSVNQNLTLKKSHAEFLSRINKFGCTLFVELCNCNTWAIPPILQIVFNINPQKSLLK